MKPSVSIALILCGSLLVLQQVQAQKSKPKPKVTAKPAAGNVQSTDVFLGRSTLSGGAISKRAFDSLAGQGLRLAGNNGTVSSFQFIYAERSLYEDSVGNPLITTDYLTEYCYGDTLSASIREGLKDRTKPGDTAYFDQIRILAANGQQLKGKAMRFVLER